MNNIVRAYYEEGNIAVLVSMDGSKETVRNAYGKKNPVCKSGEWPGCNQCERAHCSSVCPSFQGVKQ